MEGRKLALVPYKRWLEFQRFYEHQSPQLPPNPQLSKMSHLQQELQSLLNRHDLSETEKSQQYGQVLQRLQLFHKKASDETMPLTLREFKKGTLSKPPSADTATETDHLKTFPKEEEEDSFETPPYKTR